ncbi:hypothetical protein [Glaciecola sp. MF2-115]|uniref:hypothetical protein n=1 Tax=Glaciecola sp. MF2-115 TaxID=3384827 RepID=UPI0039A21BE8
MDREDGSNLFHALARMDSPLSRTCEKAIDTIKHNPSATEDEKTRVKSAVMSLLKGNQELHEYLSKNFPEFDFTNKGNVLFNQLKNKYDGKSGV